MAGTPDQRNSTYQQPESPGQSPVTGKTSAAAEASPMQPEGYATAETEGVGTASLSRTAGLDQTKGSQNGVISTGRQASLSQRAAPVDTGQRLAARSAALPDSPAAMQATGQDEAGTRDESTGPPDGKTRVETGLIAPTVKTENAEPAEQQVSVDLGAREMQPKTLTDVTRKDNSEMVIAETEDKAARRAASSHQQVEDEEIAAVVKVEQTNKVYAVQAVAAGAGIGDGGRSPLNAGREGDGSGSLETGQSRQEVHDNPEPGTIRGGVTLTDLVTERGYNGEGLKAFVYDLLDEWHATITPKVLQEIDELSSQTEDRKLQPVTLSVNGADVLVLGVTHGLPNTTPAQFSYTPYAKEVRRFITTSRGQGRRWFEEQNLYLAFGLQGQTTSLSDADAYDKQIRREKGGELSSEEELREFQKRNLAHTFLRGNEARKIKERFMEIDLRNNGGINSTLLADRMLTLSKLPEPLDMEIGLALAWLFFDDRSNPAIDRSVMQAREFRSHIEPGSLYGLLTGFMHESQVVYCLTHPDYDPHKSVRKAMETLDQGTAARAKGQPARLFDQAGDDHSVRIQASLQQAGDREASALSADATGGYESTLIEIVDKPPVTRVPADADEEGQIHVVSAQQTGNADKSKEELMQKTRKRAEARQITPETAIRDMQDVLETGLTTEEELLRYLHDSCQTITIGNTDIVVASIEHASNPQLPFSLEALAEADNTSVIMLEYYEPEIKDNISKIPFIGKKWVRKIARRRALEPKTGVSNALAEIAQDRGIPVAIADIANGPKYSAAYGGLFLAEAELAAISSFYDILPAAITLSLLAGMWGFNRFQEFVTKKGMFDKDKIHPYERVLLDTEDARRVLVEKGLRKLVASNSASEEESARILVAYPQAHAMRVAQYLMAESLNDRVMLAIKRGLYQLIPGLDSSIKIPIARENPTSPWRYSFLSGWK